MIINTYLTARLKRLQKKLQDFDGLLISDPANITYLTGVTPISHQEREVFLIVTPESLCGLISPLRFDQFSGVLHGKFLPFSKEYTLSKLLTDTLPDKATVGIEANNLTVAELEQLKSKTRFKYTSTSSLLANQRMAKDDFELTVMKKASQITARAWQLLQPSIVPGVSEKQTAMKLMTILVDLGADGVANGFPPIVAFGKHSAIPHHTTSAKKLVKGETVLVDFGCVVNGYTSDMTRTVYTQRPTPVQTKVLEAVNNAYQASYKKAVLGAVSGDIDKVARTFIERCGFGKYFIHTTGHGVGLDIHEQPILGPGQTTKIEENMVITIEPGIYLPNQFGFRYENTILITKQGPLELTYLK